MMRFNVCRFIVLGQAGNKNSSEKRQGTGWRTGDPLAPVKFVLTLALIVEGANNFVESIFGTEVVTEERNRLYELSAIFGR